MPEKGMSRNNVACHPLKRPAGPISRMSCQVDLDGPLFVCAVILSTSSGLVTEVRTCRNVYACACVLIYIYLYIFINNTYMYIHMYVSIYMYVYI